MRDVDLIDLIATRAETALTAINMADTPVLQNYQPNQQGVPTGPTVWFEKIIDHAYGWPSVKKIYNEERDVFEEREDQGYTTVFQISALVPQEPGNTNIPTASDLLKYLQRYLTSNASRQIYRAQGAAIFRVTDIRNPKFEDDQSQFEARPSFDITFTHNDVLVTDIPAVTKVIPRIFAVDNQVGIDQINSDDIVVDED